MNSCYSQIQVFLSLLLFIFLFFKKNDGGIPHRTGWLTQREVPSCRPVLQGLMESCPALLVSAGEWEKCNTPASPTHPETCGEGVTIRLHIRAMFHAQQQGQHFGFFPPAWQDMNQSKGRRENLGPRKTGRCGVTKSTLDRSVLLKCQEKGTCRCLASLGPHPILGWSRQENGKSPKYIFSGLNLSRVECVW